MKKMTLKQRIILAGKSFVFWAVSALAFSGIAECNNMVGEYFGDLAKACFAAPVFEETFKAAYVAIGSPFGGAILGWLEFLGYVCDRGVSPDIRLPMLVFHSAMGFMYYAIADGKTGVGLFDSWKFKFAVLAGMLIHGLSNYRAFLGGKFHWARAGYFSVYVGSWAGWCAELALWGSIGAVSYYFVRKIQKGGEKKVGE